MSDRVPLILIPGLLCTARLWNHQVENLGDIAIPQVIDHRGHSTVADLATRILAEAPERFALAGLSMGGYTAMEIFRQAPERIDRIALLDTAYLADRPEQSEGRRTAMKRAREVGIEEVMRNLLPGWVAKEKLADEAFVSEAVQMALDTGVQGFIDQQKVIMSRPDSTQTLKAITCSALVLVGELDQLTPVEVHEEMARIIPQADLAVIEGAGHLSTMEKPEAVTERLRQWLSK